MLLTARDLELLSWINKCGFVTIEHIARFLKIKEVTAYKITTRLIRTKLLQHELIFHQQKGVYRVTLRGAKLTTLKLSIIKTINLANYHHNLSLTSLLLDLQEKLNCTITYEREIRKKLAQNPKAQYQHIPDAILKIKAQKIAIELELTRKSTKRFDKIFKFYLSSLDFCEIWYFSNNTEVINFLARYSQKSKFLKVFNLHDCANLKLSS